MSEPLETPAPTVKYAPFRKRLYAYGYDSTLITIFSFLADPLINSVAHAQQNVNEQIQTLVAAGLLPEGTTPDTLVSTTFSNLGGSFSMADFIIPILASAIYNIFFLAGEWQATPGKRFCGIYVTNTDGSRLTLLQSAMRHLASGLSMLIGGLGYITIFASRKRMAWHDMLCQTVVRLGKAEASDV